MRPLSPKPPRRALRADAPTRALVGRLAREHVRPQLPRILFAFLCMGVMAAATAALARQMQPMLDRVFAAADLQALHGIAATVLVIFVIKGVAAYGQAAAMNHVGQRIVSNVQMRLFEHLMRADLAFFHDRAPGELISRFTMDSNLLRSAVSTSLTNVGRDLLTLLFLVGLMFHMDWVLASVAFFAFPAAVLPITRIGRRMRGLSRGTQVEAGELTRLLDEGFQGARQVKAYGMEAFEIGRARASIERMFRLLTKAGRTRALVHPAMETLGGFAIVAVLLYGGYQVIGGSRTPGAFFAFVAALLLAYEPLKRLASLNTNLQEGLAAAERIFAVLDTAPRVTSRAGAPLLVLRGAPSVTFTRVDFAYSGAIETPALRDLSLDIPSGWTVALVGPSGSGKSTVLNLIPRFFDVASGVVRVDGQDVREVELQSLRRCIALVSQDSVLFDDTIATNIRYGSPEASDAALVAAAKSAHAHDFILQLPAGYDTPVGPRGVKLSGGQRQRIAIARAMLRNAPILLLDEATSALDSESERQVQQALSRLKQGRTTVVIAHRLSTVLSADRIYVLDAGRVIEHGTHPELLARGGAYSRLYALQFAAEAGQSPAPLRRLHG